MSSVAPTCHDCRVRLTHNMYHAVDVTGAWQYYCRDCSYKHPTIAPEAKHKTFKKYMEREVKEAEAMLAELAAKDNSLGYPIHVPDWTISPESDAIAALAEAEAKKEGKVAEPQSLRAFLLRWTEAKRIGWTIVRWKHEGVMDSVSPPKTFYCSVHTWASDRTVVTIRDGYSLYVPDWFWDDNVLRTGNRH